jgi:hypothetical protein
LVLVERCSSQILRGSVASVSVAAELPLAISAVMR